MKTVFYLLIVLAMILTDSSAGPAEDIQFICLKTHKASNTCHYNFKVDGANYRFVDVGCKYKKDDVIKKVQEGSLFLAKDWKISCPEPKPNDSGQGL